MGDLRCPPSRSKRLHTWKASCITALCSAHVASGIARSCTLSLPCMILLLDHGPHARNCIFLLLWFALGYQGRPRFVFKLQYAIIPFLLLRKFQMSGVKWCLALSASKH